MQNTYNMEEYKKKLENFKLEGEKNKNVFRINKNYFLSSSIFFVVILCIVGYTLYKDFTGIEKMTTLKTIFIGILLMYVLYSMQVVIRYKVTIENNKIIAGNLIVDIKDIEKATVKIDKVSRTKFDKCLIITTKDKRQIKYRLNIENDLLFVKLIQSKIGKKFSM